MEVSTGIIACGTDRKAFSFLRIHNRERARGSVVERAVRNGEVAGAIPAESIYFDWYWALRQY